MFAGVMSSSRATFPNTEIGDGTVKSDRSVVVLHHFRLGRTIRFQAAVSDTSGGKHPESSHQPIIRSGYIQNLVSSVMRLSSTRWIHR